MSWTSREKSHFEDKCLIWLILCYLTFLNQNMHILYFIHNTYYKNFEHLLCRVHELCTFHLSFKEYWYSTTFLNCPIFAHSIHVTCDPSWNALLSDRRVSLQSNVVLSCLTYIWFFALQRPADWKCLLVY